MDRLGARYMRKTKYYVFKKMRYGGPFAENYWTGEVLDSGMPARCSKTIEALSFNTAREAYDAAGEHNKLNWWKVGERYEDPGTDNYGRDVLH